VGLRTLRRTETMSDTLRRLYRLCRMSINKPWNSLRPWTHPVEYVGALRYLWRCGPPSYRRSDFDAIWQAAER
jgi:hypothetical protein